LQLELVKVFNQQLPYQWGDDVMVAARLETKPWWKANEDRLDNYGSRFEFVARIEPPEDV
jgi:hypothetical protein